MKLSLKISIMSQLSDAQYLIKAGNIEEANWMLNAAKIMLEELEDKRIDFYELNDKVVGILGDRKLSDIG